MRFKPGGLLLQLFELLGLVELHQAKLALPAVEGLLAQWRAPGTPL